MGMRSPASTKGGAVWANEHRAARIYYFVEDLNPRSSAMKAPSMYAPAPRFWERNNIPARLVHDLSNLGSVSLVGWITAAANSRIVPTRG